MAIQWDQSEKCCVFRGYLEAQKADWVHILQFRSTHQYYRTAKYELHRTTGDEDISHQCIGWLKSGRLLHVISSAVTVIARPLRGSGWSYGVRDFE